MTPTALLASRQIRRWFYAAVQTLAISLFPFWTSPAMAQDASVQKTSDKGKIEEIIVTATKVKEPLQNVPITISAFSAQDIASRSMENLADVAKYTPGLNFNGAGTGQSGSNNSAVVYIRGIGQFDHIPTADPGVGIYLDGVYLGRSIGSVLELQDIQRIEVLKGPQGTLFGRNTIGGAINVITTKPSGKFDGYVDGTVGSYNRIDVNAAVDLPITSELAGRIFVGSKLRDGYFKSINAPGYDYGNDNKQNLLAQLRWQSDRVKVSVEGDYTTWNQHPGPGVITDPGGPVTTLGPIVFPVNPFLTDVTGNPYVGTKTRFPISKDIGTVWGVATTIDWDAFSWASVRSITSYRQISSDFGDDLDGGKINMANQIEYFRQHQVSEELQLIGKSERVSWLAGLFYFNEKASSLQNIDIPLFAPFYPQNIFIGDNVDSYAVFGNASWHVTPKLSLDFGIRYSYERKLYNTYIDIIAPPIPNLLPDYQIPPTQRRGSWGNFTPEGKISYRINPDWFLFASISKGFKSGTFNGRSQSVSGITKVNPETVTVYEFGFKSNLFDDRVRLNASGFFSNYKNMQVSALVPGTTVFAIGLFNAAAAEIKGGELEFEAKPTAALDLAATFGYTDSRITKSDINAQATGILVGSELPKTPQFTFSLSAGYTYELPKYGSLVLHGDYSWQDQMYHQITPTPATLEPAYGVLNLRCTYKSPNDRYEVAVFGTNVTNTTYALDRFFPVPRETISVFAPPAEWGASAKWRF